MLTDNTVLLGIIAIFNGAYLVGQRNQRADFKEMVIKLEHLAEELLVIKTEHRANYPCTVLTKPRKITPMPPKKKFTRGIGLLLLFLLVTYSVLIAY